jgi:hypothetical protein
MLGGYLARGGVWRKVLGVLKRGGRLDRVHGR